MLPHINSDKRYEVEEGVLVWSGGDLKTPSLRVKCLQRLCSVSIERMGKNPRTHNPAPSGALNTEKSCAIFLLQIFEAAKVADNSILERTVR